MNSTCYSRHLIHNNIWLICTRRFFSSSFFSRFPLAIQSIVLLLSLHDFAQARSTGGVSCAEWVLLPTNVHNCNIAQLKQILNCSKKSFSGRNFVQCWNHIYIYSLHCLFLWLPACLPTCLFHSTTRGKRFVINSYHCVLVLYPFDLTLFVLPHIHLPVGCFFFFSKLHSVCVCVSVERNNCVCTSLICTVLVLNRQHRNESACVIDCEIYKMICHSTIIIDRPCRKWCVCVCVCRALFTL